MNGGLLEIEQFAFEIEAAAVSTERATGGDHPVAGNDDRDGVAVIRHADGAIGVRVADDLSNVAIAARFAVRNFQQRPPAGELEICSAKIEGVRELAPLAREVFIELTQVRRDGALRFLETDTCRIKLLDAALKFEPYQSFARSGKKERANG